MFRPLPDEPVSGIVRSMRREPRPRLADSKLASRRLLPSAGATEANGAAGAGGAGGGAGGGALGVERHIIHFSRMFWFCKLKWCRISLTTETCPDWNLTASMLSWISGDRSGNRFSNTSSNSLDIFGNFKLSIVFQLGNH